jgi:putative flippase GtrA
MHLKPISRPIRELATYVGASGLAFLVDLGLLALLVTKAGWSTLPAACASFVAGGLVLYVLSISFVFSHRRYRDVRVEAPYFLAIGVVGLTINAAVIYLVLEKLNMHFVVAKLAAAGCTFAVNYLLRRTLLFRPITTPQTGTAQ